MSIINRIRIKNFKCYEEIELGLAKITLLTGANSSGKSSLLYSILGPIQSGEFPFEFSPNGKYVNMGDFTEMVHGQSRDRDIEIEFEIKGGEVAETITTTWECERVRDLPILKKLHARSDFYDLKINKKAKYNLTFKYYKDKDVNSLHRDPEFFNKIFVSINSLMGEYVKKVEDKNKKTIKNKKEFLDRYTAVKESVSFSMNDLTEWNNIGLKDKNFYLENIFGSVFSFFKEFDQKINYISSFRHFPERTYYETSKKDLKVGKFGENYEDQIVLWETNNHPNFTKLANILKDLGLLSEIKTARLAGGRYEILVRNKPDGIFSSISDVGFGISQFLPIIVADLQLGSESTLLIAQPEIHLHPSIQAQFADYLVDRIKNDKKRYIIETHSEYLINRIRLAICEDKLISDDLSTLYIENDGTLAKTYSVDFLTSGEIKGAPQSFFDTYMVDVLNIALSAKI